MPRLASGWMALIVLPFFSVQAWAQTDEAIFWRSVSGSSDPAEVCAYLEAYPNGKFAALAKIRARKLGGDCANALSSPSPKTASSAPAAKRKSSLNLPDISEANGPFCSSLDGEWGNWRAAASKNGFGIESTRHNKSFRPYNDFEIKWVSFVVKNGKEGSRAGLWLRWRTQDGEIQYDEEKVTKGAYGDFKTKYITAEIRLKIGSADMTVREKAKYTGGYKFKLPAAFFLDKFRSGEDLNIVVVAKGRKVASIEIAADNFGEVFDRMKLAAAKLSKNIYDSASCGFGATPAATSGLVGCTAKNVRRAGDLKNVKFFVYPKSQLERVKKLVANDPRGLKIGGTSDAPIGWFGIPYESLVFYDRNVRVRKHPVGGRRLVIGEHVNSPVFKKFAEAYGANYRCELLIEMKTCPDPKDASVSIPCS